MLTMDQQVLPRHWSREATDTLMLVRCDGLVVRLRDIAWSELSRNLQMEVGIRGSLKGFAALESASFLGGALEVDHRWPLPAWWAPVLDQLGPAEIEKLA